jgi:lactoylglutathione lyase
MRMMHTMLRVTNLDRSLKFYCDVMGMNLIRRKDYAEGRFTLAFVGYGDEKDATVIELTHNWDTDHYEMGGAYGHVADVYATCDGIKARGGKVIREAGPMKGGKTVLAFVEDPDGYKVEILHDVPNPG